MGSDCWRLECVTALMFGACLLSRAIGEAASCLHILTRVDLRRDHAACELITDVDHVVQVCD